MHFMLDRINQVNILGCVLTVIKGKKGPLINVIDLCNGIGTPWQPEVDRLLSDRRLGGVEIRSGDEAVPTIPLSKLHGFLYTMDDSDLMPAVKARLHLFQLECTDLLSDYWNKGMAMNTRTQVGTTEGRWKDMRKVSRPALIAAIKDLCKARPGLDADNIYNNLTAFIADRMGMELLADDQKFEDQKRGLHGYDAYLWSVCDLAAVELIHHIMEEDREVDDIMQHLEEAVNLKLSGLGEAAFSMVQ